MTKRVKVLTIGLILTGTAWAAQYFGTTVINGTLMVKGRVTAANMTLTTTTVNATGVSGTGTASFGANCTNGTGQPTTAAQNCWVPMVVNGSTVFVPGWK